MSLHSHATSQGEPQVTVVPPLETGDCLSRAEFERRYCAMPWLKKAELVAGVVFVGSPVSKLYADAHARLMGWLVAYVARTPRAECADNATVRLDLQNEVQPDALLRLKAGGMSTIGLVGYIEGSPEFVVEVASTSASRDMHAKLDLYLWHGVREYLVWRVLDGAIDWFRIETNEFRSCFADTSGAIKSREFPGLWLDTAAMLRGDLARVLDVVAQGTSSAEHAAFCLQQS
jgi:Uma2 family endonuclease